MTQLDLGTSLAHAKRSKQSVRVSLYVELILLDAGALIGAFIIAGWVRGESWISPQGINLALPVSVLYFTLAFYGNAYSMQALRDRSEGMNRALRALVETMLFLLAMTFFTRAGEMVSRLAFATGMISGAILIMLVRWFFHGYARRRASGSLTDDLLIIDDINVAVPKGGYWIDAKVEGIRPDLQDPEMLARLALLIRRFDRVVVAAATERQHAWSLLLKGADLTGEIVIAEGNRLGAVGVGHFNGMDTIQVSRGQLNFSNRVKKRVLDLAIALTALTFLAPLLIVVAILIKLESRGPVLFRQPRVGRGNVMFEIMKFRSMRVEQNDVAGSRSATRDDDRLTRVGRFIRRTSIDELPQLLNVVRGDMSLVGPRPHALGSLAGDKLFWEVNERYWLRHALKPGITGLAQVRGLRGATHHQNDLEMRLVADLEYLNGWQLSRDLLILGRTLAVLVHPNAY